MGTPIDKLRNLRHAPCCGYFLQGGVRAVAILDIGISLFAMILIASELVKKFPDWVKMATDPDRVVLYYGTRIIPGYLASYSIFCMNLVSTVRAILWASYFVVKIIIIGLSIFLFKNARRVSTPLTPKVIITLISAPRGMEPCANSGSI